MTLGERMRRLREARGWSLRQFGRQAGVPWNTIARIERGEVLDPHVSLVRRIADALGVSPGQLLNNAEENACEGKTLAPYV